MRQPTAQSLGWALSSALVSGMLVYMSLNEDINIGGGPAADTNIGGVAESEPGAWVKSDKVVVLYVHRGWGGKELRPVVGLMVGNVLGLLSDEWGVHVHTQDPFPAELQTRFKGHLNSGRLVVVDLKKEAIGRVGVTFLKGKAQAYTDKQWWELIPGEHVLTLSPTPVPGVLCSGADHAIEDFLEYDYIGAPWKWAAAGSPFTSGGNGAIALRRKSAMLEILTKESYKGTQNEDMWFIDRMVTHNKKNPGHFKLNDLEVGKTFSVEEIFYPSPVCVSYALRTLSKANRETVLDNCPEARALVGYLPGADWVAHPEDAPDTKCKGPNPEVPCPYP